MISLLKRFFDDINEMAEALLEANTIEDPEAA